MLPSLAENVSITLGNIAPNTQTFASIVLKGLTQHQTLEIIGAVRLTFTRTVNPKLWN